MTRDRLMEIAAQCGLTLDTERVTTGPVDGPAFREFEFTGDHGGLVTASDAIRCEWGVGWDFCSVRVSDSDAMPYLLVSSFWCGPK
jgi:hypothetical protein